MTDYKTTISGIMFVVALGGSVAGQAAMIPALQPYAPYLLGASMIAGTINAYYQKDAEAKVKKELESDFNQ